MTISTEPDLIRISILGGNTQLDSAVPAQVPVAALMPDLLAALRVDGVDGASAGGGDAGWTLARIDGARLPPGDTLAHSGVCHGDLLVVRPDRPGSRSPLVDDVADGVAAILTRDRAGWNVESSRWIGYLVCLLAIVGCVPLGRWAAADGDQPAVLTVAAAGAVVSLGIALAGRRLLLDPRTGTVTTIGACVLAALAASLAAPTSAVAAQVALACVAAGACALIGYHVSGHAPAVHTAVTTTAALGAVAGTLAAVWSMPAAQVAAVIAVLAVGVVLVAPRLAITLGRLPLPAVPTTAPDPSSTGEPSQVDGVEAVRLADRDPLGAIADLALGDMRALARQTAVTASILTGLLCGAVATAGAATVAVAASASGSAVALTLCACVVAGLAARGRTHADRVQSTILVGGAGITAVVATVAAVCGSGGLRPATLFFVLLALAVGALLLGTVAAGGDYSPPAVRVAEICEYAVLVALLPLLLWVLDVYQAVREL